MNATRLYYFRRSILDIARHTNTEPELVLDALTGVAWDEEEAGVIRHHLKGDSCAQVVPKINIKCEIVSKPFNERGDRITGEARLNVIRVEEEDDGSFTAVTDHWPRLEPAPSNPDTDPYQLGLECGRFSHRTGAHCAMPFLSQPAKRKWWEGFRDGFCNAEEPNPTPDICRACETDVVVDKGLCEACLEKQKHYWAHYLAGGTQEKC